MEDWFSDSKVLTTDEMDSATPDERSLLVGQCSMCGGWTKYDKRSQEAVCEADGAALLLQSIHSQRTFNPARKKMSKKDLRIAA